MYLPYEFEIQQTAKIKSSTIITVFIFGPLQNSVRSIIKMCHKQATQLRLTIFLKVNYNLARLLKIFHSVFCLT